MQFQDVKPLTLDGKVHLTPPSLGPAPFRYQPVRQERFPLALVSASNNKMISSTLGEFNYPELWLTLHPTDAAARGIADRDEVRVFNDLGEVHCTLTVAPSIRPGTVSLPKGIWRRNTRNGATGTALVPDSLTDLGGGACFNDARVQVASLANA